MLAVLFVVAVFHCCAQLFCPVSLPFHLNAFFSGDGGTMLKVKQSGCHHSLLPKTNLFQQYKLQRKSTAGEFWSTFKSAVGEFWSTFKRTAGNFGAFLRVQKRNFGAFLRVQKRNFRAFLRVQKRNFGAFLRVQQGILEHF